VATTRTRTRRAQTQAPRTRTRQATRATQRRTAKSSRHIIGAVIKPLPSLRTSSRCTFGGPQDHGMTADPWLPPSCSLALRPVPKTAHSRTRASDCGPPLPPRPRALHGPRSGGVENGCACGAHTSLFSREERDTDRVYRSSTRSRQTRTWRSHSVECKHASSCTGSAPFFIQDAMEIGVFEALLTRCVPFLSSLASTGSCLTRRDSHAPLHVQALSRRPCLHPRQHVRLVRRRHPPPVHHHARQPRDATKSAGALFALSRSTGVVVGVRAPPNTRVPALSAPCSGSRRL
jgi:hypothetical protein